MLRDSSSAGAARCCSPRPTTASSTPSTPASGTTARSPSPTAPARSSSPTSPGSPCRSCASQAEGGREIFGVDGTPRVQDVFLDPNHNGTPNAADREWRTVAIGGFREGGAIDGGGRVGDFISGYYALDMTQPDQLDSGNNPTQQTVPSCLSTTNAHRLRLRHAAVPGRALGVHRLDRLLASWTRTTNGFADLGQTWSVPIIGRIKVIEGGTVVDKFVAIFGGGMDADNKLSPKRGNWVYMVDVETGKTIYKRKVVGAAAADPAVLDTDLDGYLDTIYMGTTAGFLYKIDISSPGTLQNVTLLTTQAVPPLAAAATVKRITDTVVGPLRDLRHAGPADLPGAVDPVRLPAGPLRPRLRHRRPREPLEPRRPGRQVLPDPRRQLHLRRHCRRRRRTTRRSTSPRPTSAPRPTSC